MTQMPPPPAVPSMPYGQPPAARPTNVLAVVSLICGILGCFVITGIVGLITGFLGLGQSRLKGGRGLAIAGIILSALSLAGVLGVGGTIYWGFNKGVAIIKQPAIDTLNALVDGDIAKAKTTSFLTDDQATAISDHIKSYGHCTGLSVSSVNSSANAGSGTIISAGGTATFDKAGGKAFKASVKQQADKFVVTDLEVD